MRKGKEETPQTYIRTNDELVGIPTAILNRAVGIIVIRVRVRVNP